MEHAADAQVEKATRALREMVSGAEELIATVGEDGSEQYRRAVTRLRDQIRQARADVEDLQAGVRFRARQLARSADRAAREHPWATAGGALATGAAIGALLGILATRRLDETREVEGPD
jgi:ElaB/YqjD/DUF883 family membrane-anchored ribosome-binding protein